MIRSKLIYLALLCGLTIFYILYIESLPLLFLISVLLLPIILKAGLVWLHFRSEGTVSCQVRSCTAETSVPVTVTVRNRSPFFFSRGEAVLRVVHSFGTEPETVRLKFPVRANNTTSLSFYMQAVFCGAAQVKLVRLRVFDLFRLFHTNIPVTDRTVSLLILPKPLLLPLEETAPPAEQPDSEQFADKPGDDPSEIYGIREYMPGDPVSRMHWKLSSRSETMMLKEFSCPVERLALLLVEYQVSGNRQADLKAAQLLLTAVYSVALELMTLSHPCILAWYDTEQQQLFTQKPADQEALAESFRLLYHSLFSMEGHPDPIREALAGMVFSSATLFTNQPDTGLISLLEKDIIANQRDLLITGEVQTLPVSDRIDVQVLRPDEPVHIRLIV